MEYMLTILIRKSYPNGGNNTYSDTFAESEWRQEGEDDSRYRPVGPMEMKHMKLIESDHFLPAWIEFFGQSETKLNWMYDDGVTFETRRKEKK